MASDSESSVRRRGRPGRPRRGERDPLSRERIVEEALRMIDGDGPSGLSMRALAQRLQVEAMTLYAYIANKDALLNAVADRVAGDLWLPPAPHADWQARIRNAVGAWARMEEMHPGAFPLLYRARTATEAERAVGEEIMDALATAGFGPAEVALAYQTLISFLDGALLNWPRSRWRSPEGWAWVAAHIDAGAHPRLAETARHGQHLTWEEVFYTGLDLFLRGLQDRLQTLPARAPADTPTALPGRE
jgi:AcrR family transcriptional regulator